MNWFEGLNPVIQSFIATIFTWGITALGALIVCFFKEMNGKILDTILGFSESLLEEKYEIKRKGTPEHSEQLFL